MIPEDFDESELPEDVLKELEVTPDQRAYLDQIGAAMRDHAPVLVPYIPMYQVMMRFSRLKRLRDVGIPQEWVEREWKLIEDALEKVEAWCKEMDSFDVATIPPWRDSQP